MKKKVIVVIFLLSVLVLITLFYINRYNKDIYSKINISDNYVGNDKINLVKDDEKINSKYVKLVANTYLYDSSEKVVGVGYSGSEYELDDNYIISDDKLYNGIYYVKIKGNDVYIKNDSLINIEGIKIDSNTEYETYKNYITYDTIITKDNYNMYVGNDLYYSIRKSDKYDIVINDVDKYGIVFNDRLVYINKSDVKEVIESNHELDLLEGLPVLNYHYTVNKEELLECTPSICMEDKQVEEEIKYLADNGYYALTMRDVYLFLSGKIKLPKKSVVITIDDGWYLSRMIKILEKYKMKGTLFLIGSLASPNDYKSDYLEIHSHSWNMHTPGICNGAHGGAILCWDKVKILEDLKKSRDSLNNTTVYCFPFYEYNDKAIDYLKEAGFDMAFIGGDRKARVGDNLYKIPRYVLINSTDIDSFISYVTNT